MCAGLKSEGPVSTSFGPRSLSNTRRPENGGIGFEMDCHTSMAAVVSDSQSAIASANIDRDLELITIVNNEGGRGELRSAFDAVLPLGFMGLTSAPGNRRRDCEGWLGVPVAVVMPTNRLRVFNPAWS